MSGLYNNLSSTVLVTMRIHPYGLKIMTKIMYNGLLVPVHRIGNTRSQRSELFSSEMMMIIITVTDK